MNRKWNTMRYRLFLLLVLLVLLALIGWYCMYLYQKGNIPKEATLVKREIPKEVCDEGKA